MRSWLIALALVAAACVPTVEEVPGGAVDSRVLPVSETSPGRAGQETVAPADTDLVCPEDAGSGERARTWSDVTEAWGMVDPLLGMFVHAAAWGDVDGDGRPDLVVGTFADRDPGRYRERGAEGPSPDRLLLGGPEGFTAVDLPAEPGRTSGAVFVDLDGDGDDDLALSRNAGLKNQMPGGLLLFENVAGELVLRVVLTLPGFQARTVGTFDVDRDGRLDLVVAEDRYGETGTRIFANGGDWTFTDITERAGIGVVFGLGLTTLDLSGDGIADLFVAGDNRLFLGVGDGTFRMVDSSVFEWARFGPEDLVGGVAAGDVDGDGLPDLVVGHHFNSTVEEGRRVPVRLYLNRGGGRFDDVTERAGLVGLPTKAPHVEVADLDNDGVPDILTSAGAGDRLAVFWGRGVEAGIPRFDPPEGLGTPRYWVAAPTVDLDGDGVLDVFLAEFEPSAPSRMLLGGGGGNWLEVSVEGPGRGVGTVVEVRDRQDVVLGVAELTPTAGYSSGRQAVAHVGLGTVETVDVVLRLPEGGEVRLDGVEANRRVRWDTALREFLITC